MDYAAYDGFLMMLSNLWIVPIGVLLGIIVGAIPGLSSSNSLALLLPVLLGLPVETALIFGVSLYCGAEVGNSYPAILVNIPGTGSAAVTTFDGYPMAKKGLAAEALGISIMASFIGGIVGGTICLIAAPTIGMIALKLSSVEMSIIMLFGVAVLAQLSSGGIAKGLLAGFFGLLVATTGADPIFGQSRATFGSMYLMDGMPVIPALIGLLAFSELFISVQDEKEVTLVESSSHVGLKGIIVGFKMCIKSWVNTLRSSVIGTIVGAIPGAGAAIASFIAYQQATSGAKYKKHGPDYVEFGKGNPEGVIASEASNNGVVGGSLIPLLTLGVPGSGSMAVLMVVMGYQGLALGPQLFEVNGDVAYAVLWAQFAGAAFMLIIGTICAYSFYRLAYIPTALLVPVVSVISLIGGYAPRQYVFDMILVLIFGLIGYMMKRYEYPPAAMLLGIILGPLLEANAFRGLKMGLGSPAIFFTRPISIFLWSVLIITMFGPMLKQRFFGGKKTEAN